MSKATWERIPGESYRKDGITVYRVLAAGGEGWFFKSAPWKKPARLGGPFTTAKEAMESADRVMARRPARVREYPR